ncbi:Biopolymer transport protein ExbD/TolR [Rhodopirellula maiorica SM1]|uniref:Biopolymer transport protein ExbD/TolR n=1 Tax=Rhodopirellula maiorica SM1 TaxID=1265738 RepID=M5RH09_9BACT|nr:biopolymer transporter ExbD [Rhodopirellula maiorica]EMI18436.1 Biopolymer transport protein ExbD/TolR [Rhodopirellula maiorica SM1]
MSSSISAALPARKGLHASLFRRGDDLDMTPMVDVTFLLLIFFMVTASFGLQRAIEMQRTPSEKASLVVATPVDSLSSIELSIHEQGDFVVTTTDWSLDVVGKQQLVTTLRRAVGDSSADFRLDVQVHEKANLQSLVSGLDAASIAGLTNLAVHQVEEF